MALFKILRGGKSTLKAKTIQDGWAYFTPEDKGFYIDVKGNVNGTSYNSRLRINDRSLILNAVVSFSKGSDGSIGTSTIVLSKNDYPSLFVNTDSFYDISIEFNQQQIAPSFSEMYYSRLASYVKSNMRYSVSNSGDKITITLASDIAINVPLKIIITPKENASSFSIQ